jgi:hypothetical protein
MVRAKIDRRRRAVLRAIAAAAGSGALAGTAGRGRSGSASERGVPMSERRAAGVSAAPDFVVSEAGETARVLERGTDDPVFEGEPGAAFQYAVDAGERGGTGTAIATGPGTYELERTVTLASSTWLAGSGSASTLRAGPGLDADLLALPPGAEHVRVSDFRLDGNRANNAQGSCLAVRGGTWRVVLERLVVRDGAGDGVRFGSGPSGAYSYEPTLADIDVARCAGDGGVFGYTGDLFATNLYAEACGGYGFTLADAGGTLVHPHAYDTRGDAGIRVLESSKDTVLLGAHSEGNRRHGLLVKGDRVTVRDGFVANNSRDDPGAYSGVVLDGARDTQVTGSTLVNDSDRDRTQGAGLVETAASRDNHVTDNLFRGNLGAAVERESPSNGSTYRDNRGYPTENGGRTAVGDGGRVEHGLAREPTRSWVESTEPGTYAHVVAADRTQLVVEVLEIGTGEPPGTPVDVSWGAALE